MTFRELELFLVVADERSFVKAARKLFISQPAVTQQIKKMENELGFSLLYRDKHTVELTAPGEVMQNAARSILYTYNHAIASALRSSTSDQSLNIGYLGQMNLTLLPEIMKSFQLHYPNFSVLASRVMPAQISALLEQGLLQMIMTPYDFVANNRESRTVLLPALSRPSLLHHEQRKSAGKCRTSYLSGSFRLYHSGPFERKLS